jgi:phage baseplate assembly protein W
MNLHGTSIHFPFRPDARGSVATTATRSEIIAQAIADVIETRQGERVMMPDYGIPDFVFAVQDIGFAARIAYYIEQQVLKYVPLVKSITAKGETDENGRAIVSIQYTEVGEINAPQNLVFPVWQFTDGFSVANSSPVTNNENTIPSGAYIKYGDDFITFEGERIYV